MRNFRPILDEYNISEQQWRVLRALNDSEVALSAGALAESTQILGPSLSRMLASLEEREMIHRSTAPDGRTSRIEISTSGSNLVATIGPVSESAYADIERKMGSKELSQLLELLTRLSKVNDPES